MMYPIRQAPATQGTTRVPYWIPNKMIIISESHYVQHGFSWEPNSFDHQNYFLNIIESLGLNELNTCGDALLRSAVSPSLYSHDGWQTSCVRFTPIKPALAKYQDIKANNEKL